MTLTITSMNIWAVLVCIVFNMILGALWYSPVLFGNIWLNLIGLKAEDISKEDANKSMKFAIIPAALSILFLWLMLSFVNAQTLGDAVITGSLISAGFIGMSAFNLVLFESRSLGLSLINVGYSFVAFNVASVILTIWK